MDNVDVALRLREAKKFQSDAQKSAKALDRIDDSSSKIDRTSTRAEKSVGRSRRGIVALGGAAKVGAAAVGVGLVAGLGKSISAFEESRKVAAQTNAVIKSTRGVANVSAKGVDQLTGSLMRKTGIDDEQLRAGANMLLTFTNIRNESGKGNKVFDETTKAATDMSVALGTSTTGAAMMLGKALNDPVKGLTKLQRSGVTFTEDQKKQIATLQESGDMLGAQKVILAEVNKEFGGSAAAQATPLKKMKTQFGELFEAVGAFAAPIVDKAATAMTKFLVGIQTGSGFGGQVAGAVRAVTGAIGGFFSSAGSGQARLAGLKGAIRDLGTIFRGTFNVIRFMAQTTLPAVLQIVRGFATTLRGIIKVIAALMKGDFRGAWNGVKTIFRGALTAITGMLRLATAPFRRVAAALFNTIRDAFKGAINWILRKWNGLEFRMPEINTHIPGVGKVGGFSVGVPDIPLLAKGGTFTTAGAAIVGDRGPELLQADRGARVTPLTGPNATDFAGLGSHGPRAPQIIQLKVGRRQLAEVFVDEIDAQAARA